MVLILNISKPNKNTNFIILRAKESQKKRIVLIDNNRFDSLENSMYNACKSNKIALDVFYGAHTLSTLVCNSHYDIRGIYFHENRYV